MADKQPESYNGIVEKFVKTDKPDKNYWVLHIKGIDKPFTIFPNLEGYNLIAPGKHLIIKMALNAKGYMNAVKIEEAPKDSPPAPNQSPGTRQQSGDVRTKEEQNRSFALSYAKDLLIAGKLERKDLFKEAYLFNLFISGMNNPTLPKPVQEPLPEQEIPF